MLVAPIAWHSHVGCCGVHTIICLSSTAFSAAFFASRARLIAITTFGNNFHRDYVTLSCVWEIPDGLESETFDVTPLAVLYRPQLCVVERWA